MDAKADLSADCSGRNALHIHFERIFTGMTAAFTEGREKSYPGLDLAHHLMSLPSFPTLMSSYTRQAPHVTPLLSLVTSFHQNGYSAARPRLAEVFVELLKAVGKVADLSKWFKPQAQEPNKPAPPLPQNPLGLLCNREPPMQIQPLVVEAIQVLCKAGINPNGSEGSPPALHAVAASHNGLLCKSSLVEVLLPLSDVNQHMANGQTLITYVLQQPLSQSRYGSNPAPVSGEHRKTIEMLLKAKCDPNVANKQPPNYGKGRSEGSFWASPLHIACLLRDESLVQILLGAKANPNQVDNEILRRTPLHLAVHAAPSGSDANFDIEEVLLMAKADPKAVDALGLSVLHYAFLKASDRAGFFDGKWIEERKDMDAEGKVSSVKIGWSNTAWNALSRRIDPIETISSLTVLPGIDVNAKDASGVTALHLAAIRGASISCLKLLKAGAKSEDEFQGNTALGLAMQRYPDTAVLLMQRSVKVTTDMRFIQENHPGDHLAESIFSYAVRQVARSSQMASSYLGAAICSLDTGFPKAQALNDTIASGQFVMLLTLIPKVGDEVLRTQKFEGGQNILHRLAASTVASKQTAASQGTDPSNGGFGFGGGGNGGGNFPGGGFGMPVLAPAFAPGGGMGLMPMPLPGGGGGFGFGGGGRFGGPGRGLRGPGRGFGGGGGGFGGGGFQPMEQGFNGNGNGSSNASVMAAVVNLPPDSKAAVKLLERGVTISKDDKGQTPIHLAAQNKKAGLMSILLKAAGSSVKELVTATDVDGYSALGFALSGTPDLDLANQLLCEGATVKNVRVPSKLKIPLLSYMIHSSSPPIGSAKMCWPQLLFGRSAPDLLLLDEEGKSCLRYAVEAQSYRMSYIKLIELWAKQAGGDTLQKLLTIPDAKGVTPLVAALKSPRRGLAPVVEMLLSLAAQQSENLVQKVLTTVDKEGLTPLMHAVDAADGTFMVNLLLRWMTPSIAAAALGTVDPHGRTPLSRAVLRNNKLLAQMLMFAAPMKPKKAEVQCPRNHLAGSKCWASAVYTGQTTAEGPEYKLIMQPKVDNIDRTAKVRQGDGWPSVKLLDEPNEVNTKFIECPNETEVTVKSTWSRWAEVVHNGNRKYILQTDLIMSGINNARSQDEYSAPVRVTIPNGCGPGELFHVDLTTLQQSEIGPGKCGRAAAFLGDPKAKGPAEVLKSQDKQGCNAIHHCISPLPFGSFENTEMLAMLIKAGVPTNVTNKAGKTALALAKVQSSGRMLECLKANKAAPADAKVEVSALTGFRNDWPVPMDLEKDVEEALEEAKKRQAKNQKKTHTEAPVEKHFHRPSAASRVVVANGTDGKPLDTVMTKVDLKRGPVPQNVFYRMQVVHEQNQDNYFLLTRWGGIGERGQYQTTPFQTLDEASGEFLKIFKSKAGNDWYGRSTFEKKHQKYQMHELKYETGGARNALQVGRWKRLPAKICPQPLRRFLNAAADPRLLERALRETNADQPLGALHKKPLKEARELLERVKELLEQKQAWEMREHDDKKIDDLQVVMDEILSCSSRLFELMPTQNKEFTMIHPITNVQLWRQIYSRLELTDDITAAAQLLLGAQAKISKMNPVDYIYSAIRARAEMLPYDSEELHLIERYINRSSQNKCRLFTGQGALVLPEKKTAKTPEEIEEQLPLWQVMEDTGIYSDPACADKDHIGQAAAAGSTWKEYEKKGDVICIRKKTQSAKGMWVKSANNGVPTMVKLTERERHSGVAAVYRLERRDDEGRAAGDSQLLFHGSGMANALSILSNGLKIKPPTAQHAGSAFGDGIYFANCFGKSAGYSPHSNGVSFMLLCEVDMGRTLESSSGFMETVLSARRNLLREKLGLPKDAKPEEHPPLMKAFQNLNRETQQRQVTDLTGTNYDSYHYTANCGTPNPDGSVVHPDGYTVPCGELLTNSQPSSCGRDEFIVFDPQRVKLRYIIEMRNANEVTVPCIKPADLEKDEDAPIGPAKMDVDEGKKSDDGEDDEDEMSEDDD